MGIEFELKFRATPAQQAAVACNISGEACRFQMETTYYDTADGALSARFYTLRRRLENGVSICTLKYPADGLGRGEIELECDSITQAIPELCKLSGLTDLPTLLEKGVAPVCGARFDRTAVTVTQPDCVLEIALDRGTLFGGDREAPLCEIEVELKAGSRQAAIAYTAVLAQTYGLTPEKRSKFSRACALAKGADYGNP